MASPQKENGFTPISNEVIEHLVNACLLGSEFSMILFVLRKTWGYQKKTDIISYSQFEKGLNISRMTVSKTIKNLCAKKILVKSHILVDKISFSFNKDYESWVVNPRILVKSKRAFGIGGYTKSSIGGYTHKRKKEITKEIYSDDTSQEDNFQKEIKEVIKLFGLFNKNNNSWFKNKTQREDIKWLVKNYTLEKVRKAILLTAFCFKDNYYPSIGTPHELREKWVKMKKFWQSKEIKDKRFIEDFDRFRIEREKELDNGVEQKKEIITGTIGGRKVTYEFNKGNI